MNEHELGFTTFFAEPTQRRVRTLVGLGPKRRKEVRSLLDHAVELDGRYACLLEGRDASAGAAEEALRRDGAPGSCYVICGDEALDGREMPLSEVLAAVSASSSGAFISCMPGRLGYFQYEDKKSAYLLKK